MAHYEAGRYIGCPVVRAPPEDRVGGAEPRVLLRRARAGRPDRRKQRLSARRPLGVDGAVVPGLLLLVARDLALHDPPRVLAWRLSHDPGLAAAAAWLGPLLPAPSGALDRDPVALLLAALATLLALGYAAPRRLRGAAVRRGPPSSRRPRSLLVVLPSVAFIGMGAAADRPYGQDGGVVQLPLAIDKILAGESPYGADYSAPCSPARRGSRASGTSAGATRSSTTTPTCRARTSSCCPSTSPRGPPSAGFDPRSVTLLFYALVVVLAARLPASGEARLAAAGIAALNPLVYWHQVFGANDLVFVAMVLGAVLLARAGEARRVGGALLGPRLRHQAARLALRALPARRALGGPLLPRPRGSRRLAARPASRGRGRGAVFLAVVLPVAALDFRAFWGDIVAYNVGLPGGDNYPLGGTPGFGFANYLVYFGRVAEPP